MSVSQARTFLPAAVRAFMSKILVVLFPGPPLGELGVMIFTGASGLKGCGKSHDVVTYGWKQVCENLWFWGCNGEWAFLHRFLLVFSNFSNKQKNLQKKCEIRYNYLTPFCRVLKGIDKTTLARSLSIPFFYTTIYIFYINYCDFCIKEL